MSDTDVRLSRNILFIKPAQRHEYRGQWLTALELSQLIGVSRATIYVRIRNNLPIDQPRKHGPVPKLYWFRNELMTAPQVAKLTGLDKSTVYDRISGDRILEPHEIPSAYQCVEDWGNRIKILPYRGKSDSVAGWARTTGLSRFTIYSRLHAGWPIPKALTTPPQLHQPVRARRNRKIIQKITRTFLTLRNRTLIHRIASVFHPQDRTPGGYLQTSNQSQGTGAGRHVLERDQFRTDQRIGKSA
jgi:predicted DNA-binding transcriptional regulator AlpA